MTHKRIFKQSLSSSSAMHCLYVLSLNSPRSIFAANFLFINSSDRPNDPSPSSFSNSSICFSRARSASSSSLQLMKNWLKFSVESRNRDFSFPQKIRDQMSKTAVMIWSMLVIQWYKLYNKWLKKGFEWFSCINYRLYDGCTLANRYAGSKTGYRLYKLCIKYSTYDWCNTILDTSFRLF